MSAPSCDSRFAGDAPRFRASSIVQDGHGVLPLLAASRRDFVVIKGINLAVGVAVGSAMMASGA